jgi:hypothetical protein
LSIVSGKKIFFLTGNLNFKNLPSPEKNKILSVGARRRKVKCPLQKEELQGASREYY